MSHRSDGHLYGDYKKSSGVNQNLRYALVEYGGRQFVFDRIFEAENFCDKNNLDPDDYVKNGDLETLKTCRKVAAQYVSVLEDVIERLNKEVDRRGAQIAQARDERDRAERENRRNILGALYDERVLEAIAKYEGACESRKVVREMQDVYQNILWFAK